MQHLTPAVFLHCVLELRQARDQGDLPAQDRWDGSHAWEILHRIGHFPASTPPTLIACLSGHRQLTIEELVDRHQVSNKSVRQVLIDYLQRRRDGIDYTTLFSLSHRIVGLFWKQIELINPDQADFRLIPDTFARWHGGLEERLSGGRRKSRGYILGPVRAFYLELHEMALENPARWGIWDAPNPVTASEVRKARERRHRVAERMADRTRIRQPLLPALLEHLNTHFEELRALLPAGEDTSPGSTLTHGGKTWRRTDTVHDRQNRSSGVHAVRLQHADTGQIRNITLEEDDTFWEWACVETMRHTGVRIEELVELTQLSIRQYQRPNGEVIGLLVIAPSKSDRERVVPVSAALLHVLAMIIRRNQGTGRSVPVVRRYDPQERLWSEPLPYLFQRPALGRGVLSATNVRQMLIRRCKQLSATSEAFDGMHFTPHDFRRIFATELVNSGLPIHIGARLLGHVNLQTTQGYVAIFEEDTVRHYQDYLARRRAQRPTDEYTGVTEQEWADFEEHFDKRKVELGSCARPYGTPCQHEHACIRCPVLQVDPKVLPRLQDIEEDLHQRRARAKAEGWEGEIEGIDLTMRLLQEKIAEASRTPRATLLGMPKVRS
ncbi:tyrosine-type recombinase/integrase [Arthrobacter sp. CP30]